MSTQIRLAGIIAALIVVAALVAILPQNVSAQETAKGLLAIQARSQGYPCDVPVSASRKSSKRDVSVWVLRCDRNSYRMTLAPDMAARVQPLK